MSKYGKNRFKERLSRLRGRRLRNSKIPSKLWRKSFKSNKRKSWFSVSSTSRCKLNCWSRNLWKLIRAVKPMYILKSCLLSNLSNLQAFSEIPSFCRRRQFFSTCKLLWRRKLHTKIRLMGHRCEGPMSRRRFSFIKKKSLTKSKLMKLFSLFQPLSGQKRNRPQ